MGILTTAWRPLFIQGCLGVWSVVFFVVGFMALGVKIGFLPDTGLLNRVSDAVGFDSSGITMVIVGLSCVALMIWVRRYSGLQSYSAGVVDTKGSVIEFTNENTNSSGNGGCENVSIT